MQQQEARDRLSEQNDQVAASVEVSAEQKSEAYDENQMLQQLAQHEEQLETLIRAKGGYEDVLVSANEDEIQIYVQASELTKEETIEIMQMAVTEVGEGIEIAVGHR